MGISDAIRELSGHQTGRRVNQRAFNFDAKRVLRMMSAQTQAGGILRDIRAMKSQPDSPVIPETTLTAAITKIMADLVTSIDALEIDETNAQRVLALITRAANKITIITKGL